MYDERDAVAFETARHLPREGLTHWREAVARYLHPRPGMRLLDLGAGTGMWASAFADWYGIEVVAVEPAEAMRARSSFRRLIAGHAATLPLKPGSVDGAWLSTVIHHLPDLEAVAAELRRVMRPDAPLLIRQAFPGRHRHISLFRFFPEAIEVLNTYPTVANVCAALGAAGFAFVALESVPQVTADSLKAAADRMRRDAHTPLKLITKAEYERGLSQLRAAADAESGPVVDRLDLLVLR